MYIDKLDDTVDKYNNTYHRTIKMKPINVNYIHISTYINFDVESNDEDSKFKVSNHGKILKNLFCKKLHSKRVRSFCYLKKIHFLHHGYM